MTVLGAIEGGGTKFVVGIGTPDGKIEDLQSFPTTTPEETMGRTVEYFADKGVSAIGFGSFGPVDLNRQSATYGHIALTPKPHWSHYDVVGHLKRYFDVPIGFDTDVNAAALGEATWGAAKGLNSCLYITVGTGIGAGAVVEGKLVHGLTHPEMGHILVPRHPEDTYAGKCPYHADCLEGLAAGPAIEARWGVKAYELAEDHKAWEFQAYYLAQALMNYILIMSPQKIILGGGVSKQTHLLPRIREQLRTLLNGYVHHPAILEQADQYIVTPGLQDRAGITGSIALALQALEDK
ncbi:ROK family protein [Paenibacillus sp. UMB4589-SE434]|uniref:ROK family protein n=1 Tax=Paenibacillus sp. UMB4589-SE434 TaxID=3046314 RepID=UPI00254FA345|nr:ROK family protein [Paenibacillus sp. UMB4589-SE434]MDK8182704.1 ROK family protein [Paenibacillus sp. UMB4589-SE434]